MTNPHIVDAFQLRGVTDTPGTAADEKQASGHRTDAMAALYDHELHTVDAAGVNK